MELGFWYRTNLVSFALLAGCGGMRTPLNQKTPATDPSGGGPGGAACAVRTTTHTTRAVADVIIVLDRSVSMDWSLRVDSRCSFDDSDCTTRLTASTSALEAVIADNHDIRWGLLLFPTPEASAMCTVWAEPQVAVGTDTAAAINAHLQTLTTAMSSPTAAALRAATDHLVEAGAGDNKAILLATDGLPTCATDARSWSVEDMTGTMAAASAAKQAGYPVYVIGIGPNLSNLDSLAAAGGTGQYHPATSVDELDRALRSVARVVGPCTFRADEAPTDESLVFVYVNGREINRDPLDGWVFDEADPTFSSITLTGTTCQDMRTAARSQVTILSYDCPSGSLPH
jgi:hypothetical protein